jgi:hypothetical protein
MTTFVQLSFLGTLICGSLPLQSYKECNTRTAFLSHFIASLTMHMLTQGKPFDIHDEQPTMLNVQWGMVYCCMHKAGC